MANDFFLDKKLDERTASNSLRKLVQVTGMIDFSSNDYLGIMTNKLLQPFIEGKKIMVPVGPALLREIILLSKRWKI